MAVCDLCEGTRLKVQIEYKGNKLFTNDECVQCGGKGYVTGGETEYRVVVTVDDVTVQRIYALARNATEALLIAAEMFHAAYGERVKGEEVIRMEVEER